MRRRGGGHRSMKARARYEIVKNTQRERASNVVARNARLIIPALRLLSIATSDELAVDDRVLGRDSLDRLAQRAEALRIVRAVSRCRGMPRS